MRPLWSWLIPMVSCSFFALISSGSCGRVSCISAWASSMSHGMKSVEMYSMMAGAVLIVWRLLMNVDIVVCFSLRMFSAVH